MSNTNSTKPDIKSLKDKSMQFALRIGVIFALTAVAGVFVGGLLDRNLGIAPWGTIGSLLFLYLLSWIFVIKMYFDIQKEINSKSKTEKTKK